MYNPVGSWLSRRIRPRDPPPFEVEDLFLEIPARLCLARTWRGRGHVCGVAGRPD